MCMLTDLVQLPKNQLISSHGASRQTRDTSAWETWESQLGDNEEKRQSKSDAKCLKGTENGWVDIEVMKDWCHQKCLISQALFQSLLCAWIIMACFWTDVVPFHTYLPAWWRLVYEPKSGIRYKNRSTYRNLLLCASHASMVAGTCQYIWSGGRHRLCQMSILEINTNEDVMMSLVLLDYQYLHSSSFYWACGVHSIHRPAFTCCCRSLCYVSELSQQPRCLSVTSWACGRPIKASRRPGVGSAVSPCGQVCSDLTGTTFLITP